MSLEFAVQHPCTLRARYSEKHLREWGRLSSIHAALTTGDSSAPTEDKIDWVNRAALEIDRLQSESAICGDCPACLPAELGGYGEALGCLGRINYPIDAEFEKFVANRLQLVLDTLDPQDWPRLLHIAVDPESPFDGEATKELRRVTTKDGLRFFELRVPIKLARAGANLTTDNRMTDLSQYTHFGTDPWEQKSHALRYVSSERLKNTATERFLLRRRSQYDHQSGALC